MIHITPGDSRPIFKQIVDALRVQIVTGGVGVGTRLPSVRGLAMQLTVNPNTVSKAYQELIALGLVESQPGRGLFVAPRRQLFSEDERNRRINDALDAFVGEVIGLGYSRDEMVQRLDHKLKEMGIDAQHKIRAQGT